MNSRKLSLVCHLPKLFSLARRPKQLDSTSAARRSRPRLEQLEARLNLSGYAPTGLEQEFLERLNDARANPAAYGQSIGLDLSGVAPSQPLAFNTSLVQSSRDHSLDMSNNNYFGHNGSDGSTPFQRMSADGFPWVGAAESIAAGQASVEAALSALVIDAGVADLGHRKQLLSLGGAPYSTEQQTGVGVVMNGSGSWHDYYTIDSGNTANSNPFLTGVAFNDANKNGLYDNGEGLGGATITATGPGGTYQTTTWGSGGYSLQVVPGTYTVTATGAGMGGGVSRTVTVGAANYRLNFNPPAVNADWSKWTNTGGSGTAPVAGRNADGSQQEFMIGTAGAVWVRAQAAGGAWGSWASLGGIARGLAVTTNRQGLQDVFVIGQDKALWTRSETAAGQWTAWTGLGGIVSTVNAATAADGTEQVFGIGSDGGLWMRSEGASGQWGAWTGLGGLCAAPALTRNAAGWVDAFVRGVDGALWTRSETALGQWTGWTGLGGSVASFAVGTNANGVEQVFAVSPTGAPSLLTQSAAGAWGSASWVGLGGNVTAPVVARNRLGLLDLFAVGNDGAVWTRAQTSAGTFTAWTSLGGGPQGFSATSDAKGLITLWASAFDSTLWLRAQTAPGAW